MKRFPTFAAALAACLLIVVCSANIAAQTIDDVTSIRAEIERNAELLEKARELVGDASGIKARASLETAAKLHLDSIRLLESGRFSLAAQAAKKAREAIHQTIALAKKEALLEETAMTVIERAERRLEQALGLLTGGRDGEVPAQKLIDEAHTQLQRARDSMREHLYEVALHLARSSAQLSERAITMLRRDFTDLEKVNHELQKTDRVLERLSEQMGAGAPATVARRFEEASALQQRAWDNLRRKKPRVALDLTHKARNIAARALRLLVSNTNGENVEQALRLTDALLEQARDMALNRDSSRLSKQIDQAEDVQMDAKNQFQQDHYDRALQLTLRARKILKSTLADMKPQLRAREVKATLEKTDDLLQRLSGTLAETDDETIHEIFERASAHQKKAWESFEKRELRAALSHTRMAKNMAQKAARRLNNEDS